MLARIRKAMDEREGGFTLIELLVVIIIIGILAAIAIPVFLNQRKKGVDASMKSDLRNGAVSEETYLTDNNAYTTGTASNLGAVVAAANLPDFKPSPGNTVTFTVNAGSTAYCINATNGGGSHAWTYVSSQGGLQAGTVIVCPGTF